MPEPITNMETMEKGRSKSFRAYLVALLNMEIRMYNEKQLVHSFKCDVMNIFGKIIKPKIFRILLLV